jgi:hypothetical protein
MNERAVKNENKKIKRRVGNASQLLHRYLPVLSSSSGLPLSI